MFRVLTFLNNYKIFIKLNVYCNFAGDNHGKLTESLVNGVAGHFTQLDVNKDGKLNKVNLICYFSKHIIRYFKIPYIASNCPAQTVGQCFFGLEVITSALRRLPYNVFNPKSMYISPNPKSMYISPK